MGGTTAFQYQQWRLRDSSVSSALAASAREHGCGSLATTYKAGCGKACWEGRNRLLPGAPWPPSLAKAMSSAFREKSFLRKEGGKRLGGCPMSTSGYHRHTNTCANICVCVHTDIRSLKEKSVYTSLGFTYLSPLLLF